MDIVEKVAADIAEIPGNPSPREIARIAIESYQDALWPPMDFDVRTITIDRRRIKAQQLTAHIMHTIGKYLCPHGDIDGAREANATLFKMLYEAGADIITDLDRANAGLPSRDHSGLTKEELHVMEAKRIEAMLKPMPTFLMPAGTAILNK